MKILIFLSLLYLAFANEKFISVKGKLLCGEHPAFNILVRLWPHKEEKGFDVLAEEFTTHNGTFLITGKVFTDKHHVVLKVYHDCSDGLKAGQRKLIFHIPTKYATSQTNGKPYEFGELNLETRFKHDEEREIEPDSRRRRRKDLVQKTTTSSLDRFASPEERNDPW